MHVIAAAPRSALAVRANGRALATARFTARVVKAAQPSLRPSSLAGVAVQQRAACRQQRIDVRVRAAAEEVELDPLETTVSKVVGKKFAPAVVTLTFIAVWYGLNIAFNLQNKVIFNYFPYPW
eukprot:scaffold3.g6752.t1